LTLIFVSLTGVIRVYFSGYSRAVKYTSGLIKDPIGRTAEPKNYSRKEHGDVALHAALAHSYNLATVRIGMDIGVGRIAKTLRETGVKRPVNADRI
jgi:penicillin-binding protein 1B